MQLLRQLFILGLIIWIGQTQASAQKTSPKTQVGIEVNGLASINSSQNFRVGLGRALGLWIAQPLNNKNTIELTFSYSHLTGYHFKTTVAKEFFFPQEYQVTLSNTELNSLSYLNAGLNWKYRPKENSPWEIGLGVQVSHLADWEAYQTESTRVVNNEISLTETSFSGGTNGTFFSADPVKIDTTNFNRLDYGLRLQVAYRLREGFILQSSFYQGFQKVFARDVFANAADYKIRYISLGVKIRLL